MDTFSARETVMSEPLPPASELPETMIDKTLVQRHGVARGESSTFPETKPTTSERMQRWFGPYELLAELGDVSVKPRVKSLKLLQDELGNWHDRYVLLQLIAECIGRPDFLVEHPEAGRALLIQMERERHKNELAVGTILKSAEKTREAWGEPRAVTTQENLDGQGR